MLDGPVRAGRRRPSRRARRRSLGDLRRRAGGHLHDRGEAMLLVAGIDALGAVAAEEVDVELQARFAAPSTGTQSSSVHPDRRSTRRPRHRPSSARGRRCGCADQGREVRTLVALDGRRHGNDEDVAAAQVLRLGVTCSAGWRLQLFGGGLECVIDTALELGERGPALISKPSVWKALPNSTASGRPT